ncbi:MAG: Holliday junction resolvase RuvX [bacterium]
MAVLAIDYGRRKIGLALSRANFVASRYKTLLKSSSIFDEIKEIIKKEKIYTIVFGLPRGLDGKVGTLENEAKKFASKIEKQFDLPIIYVDEGFTSEQAMQNLKSEGIPFKKSKLIVDQEAARIILEEYLNTKRTFDQV